MSSDKKPTSVVPAEKSGSGSSTLEQMKTVAQPPQEIELPSPLLDVTSDKLYFIQKMGTNVFNIGIAKNIPDRLLYLQEGNDVELGVFGFCPTLGGENGWTSERLNRYFSEKLYECRVRGNWYEVTRNEIMILISEKGLPMFPCLQRSLEYRYTLMNELLEEAEEEGDENESEEDEDAGSDSEGSDDGGDSSDSDGSDEDGEPEEVEVQAPLPEASAPAPKPKPVEVEAAPVVNKPGKNARKKGRGRSTEK